MILGILSGVVLETCVQVPDASAYGFLGGVVVAIFIPPGSRGCRIE